MIKVMFYHKFKHSIKLSSSCSATERYELDMGNGRKSYQDLSIIEYRKVHPVPIVETSLPALQAAGINPAQVNVSGLLDPTNVGTMQHISERVLNDFALDYNPPSENPLDNV